MRQLIVLLAVLTCCEHALAMGGGHGTKPVNLSDSHLSELANRPGRVGGYWVNSNDWFYFAGDTKALNDFLRRYAEMKGTPLVLVIHPGKAPAEACVGDLFAEPYDWKLDSMYRGFTRDKTWFQKPDGGQWPGSVVIVQAWLGGNVRLDDLEVPANIEVRPGGEIGEFIKEHNKKKAECSVRQKDVLLRGAAASCRHLCLDIDEDAKVEQIGGATSSRCLRLATGKAPDARWKLTETERGHLIQAQTGKLAGWYLDFDDDAQIGEMGGATSSMNLLLTEQMVPGAYWKVTETDEGFLIQAQAGRFEGWYLDLNILTKQKVTGAFWQIEATNTDTSPGEATSWGKPVEGVQCRLLPEKSTWKAGQTPRLQADLRNRGKGEVNLGLAPENWEVQYDGVWYRSTARNQGAVELLRLKPGAQRDGI